MYKLDVEYIYIYTPVIRIVFVAQNPINQANGFSDNNGLAWSYGSAPLNSDPNLLDGQDQWIPVG